MRSRLTTWSLPEAGMKNTRLASGDGGICAMDMVTPEGISGLASPAIMRFFGAWFSLESILIPDALGAIVTTGMLSFGPGFVVAQPIKSAAARAVMVFREI